MTGVFRLPVLQRSFHWSPATESAPYWWRPCADAVWPVETVDQVAVEAEQVRVFAGRVVRPAGVHFIELLTNHGHTCRYRLRCHLKDRFKAARNRLWLTTPYFLPDAGTQRDLCRAASDGVDVRVLVPGKNDVPFVQWASRATYSRLLAAGIRIFEYQPRVLHAKTLIVDDDWSTVGSANLDYRSLFINYELTLAADCQSLNTALATIFEIDLNESIEVQREPWLRRPLSARMAEFIGWSARHWL
ncbi:MULTISPECIES: phospholipase D-like domain-containing protein [unclassified Halomonas]|uniref:phospholipase D-like domain-containing protein n=1 Tax=unclassified Halomonas TaxID=2609666 RepID=UPI0024684E68|nr:MULTISPECIES: phospholipase D-like domain-containing protein [unclassified Halomonas]